MKPSHLATLLALIASTSLPAAENAAAPAPGTTFKFSPASPKWATCDIEFRDPAGERWPVFFYGKPAEEGALVFDPQKPQLNAGFAFDQMPQKQGDPGRKVLAALLTPGTVPAVSFAVKSLGPLRAVAAAGKSKEAEAAEIAGELSVGAKRLPVRGEAVFRFDPKSEKATGMAVALDVRFTIKASQLGMQPEGEIAVRIHLVGYAE